MPLKSHLWLKARLSLKFHLFQKRLGLAHALLGAQGAAESFRYYALSSFSPYSLECVQGELCELRVDGVLRTSPTGTIQTSLAALQVSAWLGAVASLGAPMH